jgi:hypothetical protein
MHPVAKRLNRFLASVDSHVGKTSPYAQRLADSAQISLSGLQSISYGRRNPGPAVAKLLERALGNMERRRDRGLTIRY